MRRATACVLLLVLALAGCGGSSKDEQAAARARAQARAHARRMEIGRRVFAKHCRTCHTLAGRRYTVRPFEWEAPNLDEVRLDPQYVRDRVTSGGPAMAAFSGEVTEAEFDAIVDYILETAGRDVVDEGGRSPELVDQGREVFAQSCAACHGIEGSNFTGRPTYPGIDFNVVKPSVRYVIYMMRKGVLPDDPEVLMPRFTRRLSSEQMRAVATYVNAVANEGPPPPPQEEATE